MRIVLNLDGEEKIYVAPFIPARAFRKVLELKHYDLTNLDSEQLDELVGIIVNTIFKNQFTIDEFYDGLPAKELIPSIEKIIFEVAGDNAGEDVGNVPQG